MTESGFPNTHTTETSTQRSIYMDQTYFKSTSGILKIIEMLLDLLGFICTISGFFAYTSGGTWFNFVAMFAFWYTGVLFALELFHVPEKVSFIPWIKAEFIFSAIITFFYIIASTICAAHANYETVLGASAFFGYSAMVLYGYETWRSYSALKNPPKPISPTTTTAQA